MSSVGARTQGAVDNQRHDRPDQHREFSPIRIGKPDELGKVGRVGIRFWTVIARLRIAEVEKLSNYLRISEAAEHLGVSPNTLRNWVNAGKIVAIRHPVNALSPFQAEDLDAVLKKVAVARKKAA